jgi:hypothetical protein
MTATPTTSPRGAPPARTFPIGRWLLRLGLPALAFAIAYWLVFTLRFLRDYVPHGGIS